MTEHEARSWLLELLYLVSLVAVASLAWEAGFRACAWHNAPWLLR